MLVTINVTQEDINEGEAGSAFRCMVARAISRWINCDIYRVSVCSCIIIVDVVNGADVVNSKLVLNALVGNTVLKIRQFDNWKTGRSNTPSPNPFSFELDIPIECLKMDVPTSELVPA